MSERDTPPAADTKLADDTALERFSRQITLPSFDFEGQEALARASVLVVGCGGLGTPAAMYLAAAGVGRLVLMDDDRIEISNLPRQIAFEEADVGSAKVDVLARRLRGMNSALVVETHGRRFDESSATQLEGIDAVLDATDNRAARLAIDAATAARRLPWFMGAAAQMSGQMVAFSPDRSEGCYHCLAPEQVQGGGSCSELGILGPVVGSVALAQVLDVIGYLSGCRAVQWGLVRMVDFARDERWQLPLTPRPDCVICRARG